jgi:phage baseplate assembly protein W
MPGFMRTPLEVTDLMLAAPFAVSNRDGRGSWRTLSSVDNLLQALWVRLNTPEGMLAELGHPDYGSRLYRLVGELDTPETRDRARLYVVRALSREPRVARILAVQVHSEAAGAGRTLAVHASVLPVGQEQAVPFAFSVLLEPAP